MKKWLCNLILFTIIGMSTIIAQGGQNILIDEQFIDNKNNWYEWNYEYSRGKIQNGYYLFEYQKENREAFWKEIRIDEQKDFTIEATIKRLAGKDDHEYGILWGIGKDWDNCYEFLIQPAGYYCYRKRMNASSQNVIDWTESKAVKNDVNVLTVKKRGMKILFFINGQYVNETNFERFFSDNVGFIIYKQQQVGIDHLQIIEETPVQIAEQPRKRIALLIGNSAYQEVPLKNPVNDAKDMAEALDSLQFNVITKFNLNQREREMEEVINEFFKQIQNGDVALFYFSGHGSQVQGENYLLPVGEHIQSESDIRYKAVNAGYILGKMEESGNRTNIMILDACRNNPFKSVRSLSKGLTIMEAPGGTFIAYATAPGKVALDGTERNGVYTKYLLEALRIKGMPIEQAFKSVLKNVEKETNGQQIPWTASSLREDFSFNP